MRILTWSQMAQISGDVRRMVLIAFLDGQKALAKATRRRIRSLVEVQLSPFAIHRTRRNTRVRRRRRTYRILLDVVLALTLDHLHEVQGQVLYGLEESAL